ncbi:class I SAM-dependent methyltransferase [Frateuria aurantia]
MSHYSGPLLTRPLLLLLQKARDRGATDLEASFDLGRHATTAEIADRDWRWQGRSYPYPEKLKDRTIYYFDGEEFSPVARFSDALIKLVPTEWGAPTFEIDGIKMLPSARESPFEDARRKVALIAPAGKTVLDTCGGLGYFAACALEAGVARIISFEKNADVLWLRQINAWSPDPEASAGRLQLHHGDSSQAILAIPDASVDAVLHDPPRFGIAGELYAQSFYQQLARVIRRGGRLFHYTGSPNKLTSGRDVPGEVASRLAKAGFKTERVLDGVQGIRG